MAKERYYGRVGSPDELLNSTVNTEQIKEGMSTRRLKSRLKVQKIKDEVDENMVNDVLGITEVEPENIPSPDYDIQTDNSHDEETTHETQESQEIPEPTDEEAVDVLSDLAAQDEELQQETAEQIIEEANENDGIIEGETPSESFKLLSKAKRMSAFKNREHFGNLEGKMHFIDILLLIIIIAAVGLLIFAFALQMFGGKGFSTKGGGLLGNITDELNFEPTI